MIKVNDNFSVGTAKPIRETDIFGAGQVYPDLASIPVNMLHEWMESKDTVTGITWQYVKNTTPGSFHWVEIKNASTTDDVEDKSRILGLTPITTTEALNWLLDQVDPPLIKSFATSDSGLHLLKYGTTPVEQVKDPTFTFTTSGFIQALVLKDNKGNAPVNLTPTSPQPAGFTATYPTNPTTVTDVTWTLTADGSIAKSTSARWVFPTYTGKKSTAGAPTAAEINATAALTLDTRTKLISNPGTNGAEYGWFAVEKSVSATFTKWQISALNKGAIGSSEFISGPTLVSLNGVDYDVYVFNYPSAVTSNLTLN